MDQFSSTSEHIPETVLISRILAGEKQLFESIIRTYNQRLYRIGMSILQDGMAAEDAMQNAYVNAFEHLDQFEERAAFGTWLFRIMLNECLAQKKKKMKIKMELINNPGNYSYPRTPASELVNKELGLVLEKAVDHLPEKYRLVFVLREIENMSVRQTSETLLIEESNVKARLSRAKAILRDNLSGYIKENVYSFHLVRCTRMVENVFSFLKI